MRAYVEATWGRWNEAEQAEHFSSSYVPAAVRIIVVDGQDAGMIEIAARPGELFLANLALLPEFQGRGVGTRLIEEFQHSATAQGLPLALQVLKANPRARQLYGRLGFVKTGETATHELMAWRPGPQQS
jgi:ribosomal protein S18 acetylase RimI-like enzyme